MPLLMKNPFNFIVFIASFAMLVLFSSCGTVENIEVELTNPVMTNTGDQFTTVATIKNTSSEVQVLYSIDIGDLYTAGFMLMESVPNYTESMHIPFDNSTSYSYHTAIPAHGSIEVEHTWQALKQGDFRDEFDFCINSDIEFLSVEQRTIVQ